MAVSINFYDKFKEYFGDGTIDLDTDVFRAMLMNSSHTFAPANTVRTDVSANQISNGNGYTQATGGGTGKSIGTVTWGETSGTVTFDTPDVSWTASGGTIDATDLVVFSDDAATDELCWSVDFDVNTTPLSAGDNTDFLITVNASGWFSF